MIVTIQGEQGELTAVNFHIGVDTAFRVDDFNLYTIETVMTVHNKKLHECLLHHC